MKIKSACTVFSLLSFCALRVIAGEPESEFTMGSDENGIKGGKGEYLWTEPANWNRPPNPGTHVNIGSAEEVVHCVIKKTNAECGQLDLSEAGGPKGGVDNSLTIKDGGSLMVSKIFYCGKDKRGYLNIQEGGSLTVKGKTAVGFNRSTLGSHISMTGGVFNSKSLYIAAMNQNVTEGSSLSISGGKLSVSELLQITSLKADVPGLLKISKNASLNVIPPKGMTSVGYGTVMVEWGASPSISLGDLKFEKGRDSKLSLSGDSVTAITAKSVTLADATLDVSGLNLKPGDYKIIDAESLDGTFTVSDNFSKSWKLNYDTQKGDIILIRLP